VFGATGRTGQHLVSLALCPEQGASVGCFRTSGRSRTPWLAGSEANEDNEDNATVKQYLVEEAGDVEWMVDRAAIGSDGPSKGVLTRSARSTGIATFEDCAPYDYRTVVDASAIHTCGFSSYRKG
jgi:hypothetical protein